MAYPAPYETACTHKWDFNHTPVANISDSVGSITLTNHSATSVAASNGAYCYAFSGASQYLDGGTATTGIGSGSFTIEVITSENVSGTYSTIFSRFGYPSSKYWGWSFQYYAATNYYVGAEGEANNVATFALNENAAKTANKVYHWFWTANPAGGSNNYKLYEIQSGAAANTKSATYAGSPDESQSLTLMVGARGDAVATYAYIGKIFLIRIHSAVLTTTQMLQNYKAESWRYGDVYVAMTVPGSTTVPGAISPHVTKAMTVPGTTMTKGTATPVVKPVMTVPGMTATKGTATPVVKPTMTVPHTTTAPGAITPKVTKVMTVPGTTLTGSAAFAYIEMSKTVTMPCPTATLTVGHATPNIKIIMPCPDFTTDEGEIAIGVRIALTAPDITLDVNFITTTISIYALPSECDVTLEWPLVTIGFAEYPAVSTDETIEYAATETSTINEWPDETTFEEEWSRRCV